jgi:hypothetical protein
MNTEAPAFMAGGFYPVNDYDILYYRTAGGEINRPAKNSAGKILDNRGRFFRIQR